MVENLCWDSNFFNLKIGKIVWDENENLAIVDNEGYDLIYIFSNNARLNFPLVDKKIVYQINDLHEKELDAPNNIEFYQNSDEQYFNLLSLAWQSAEFSRFKLDKNFPENTYKDLYKEWLNKSISKDLATDIIIKTINDKIVGFATLARKSNLLADISLVAVDSSFRGLGIAKELVKNMIALAKQKGYDSIQVVTQLDNLVANNLYKKSGFLEINLTYIYHHWNHDTI